MARSRRTNTERLEALEVCQATLEERSKWHTRLILVTIGVSSGHFVSYIMNHLGMW